MSSIKLKMRLKSYKNFGRQNMKDWITYALIVIAFTISISIGIRNIILWCIIFIISLIYTIRLR